MRYARRRKFARKGRRSSRTLSTRNIFNNKGARAQARQISALRKRISAVNRKCAPEVKVVENNQTTSIGFAANNSITGTQQAYVGTIPYPSFGTSDQQRIGDKVRLLPAEIFMTLQYEEIYNSLAGGFSTLHIPITSSAIQTRVVFVQSKISGQSLSVDSLNEIFEQNPYSSTGNASLIDSQMAMKIPFRTGVTTKWNILSDKIITVSKDSGQKAFRFKVRPKYRSNRFFEGGSQSPQGIIYMIVLTSGWTYMHYSNAGGASYDDYNKLNFSYRARQPFTDA